MRRESLVAFALAATCCGGSSSPTAPTPIPQHNLVYSQGSATTTVARAYLFAASIKNDGTGCASGTTVSVTFLNDGQRVGADIPMGKHDGLLRAGRASALSEMTIRPGEIVALSTASFLSSSVVNRPGEKTFQLNISANSVRCP